MKPADGTPATPGRKRRWPLLRRVLTFAFFAAVAALLFSQARSVDWAKVLGVIREYPAGTLLAAAALAAGSHALYSTFDLLGRAWTGHRMPLRQVVPVTFVSYAFNLNLGSLVGGFGFRYRLYSRFGLGSDVITRVLGLSLVTNWLGYLFIGGGLFALRAVTPPDDWKIGATALQALGMAMLGAALAYLLLCALRAGRRFSIRGHQFTLPRLRMALLQLGLSTLNWALIGAVVYVLLQQRIDYPTVLGVLLVAAVAGVVTHIPAGLGVLEAVFIALLSHRVPRDEILAALIAYRGLYYLGPLLLAVAIYVLLETRARKAARAHPGGRRGLAETVASQPGRS